MREVERERERVCAEVADRNLFFSFCVPSGQVRKSRPLVFDFLCPLLSLPA